MGLNVVPSYRPWRWADGPNPDGWWDPASGVAQIDAEMPLIAEARAATARVEFPWTFIETTRGHPDWTRADAIVASAAKNEVQIRPIIVFCPPWEGAPNCVPKATDFAAFVTAMATRYRGQIHAWEFGNEPDITHYFDGTETQWIRTMLDPGYDAVKAVDPGNVVVSAGMAYPTHLGWIDALRRDDARFDVQAYHDYPSGPEQVNRDGWALRSKMDSVGYRAVPLWLDEFGTQEDRTSDTEQQSWLATVTAPHANPATVTLWYNLRDDINYCGRTSKCKDDHYGLLRHDLTHKAGFATFQKLS